MQSLLLQELREREGDRYGGSAAAFRHHYDIGNEFWPLMLGPSFVYSGALFEGPEDDLEAAQRRKNDWHMASAAVDNARSVLEIGCSWGTILQRLAERPAIERIVGLTLSAAQADYIASLGLPSPRVDVRQENWTTHEPAAPYDSIISIAALEHFTKPEETEAEKLSVYRDFFERCHRWLSPGGRMSLQTMAFGNMRREEASGFVSKDVNPDSDLPFLSELVAATEGLFEITALRNDRLDYARTYEAWSANLRRNRERAIATVGEPQVRRFERFLKMSALGFRSGKLRLLRLALRPVTNDWSIAGSDLPGRSWLRLA
jgi:cyclopropane-fatty-acyl-phospholipid synthase